MLEHSTKPEVVCYEYVEPSGDVVILMLDEAGIPISKNRVQRTLSNQRKPKPNEIFITRIIDSVAISGTQTQNAFEYCFSLELENDISTAFSKFDDEDWYKMFSEVEREIPVMTNIQQVTIH